MTDPLGNLTAFDYNGRDLLIRMTDARGGVTSLAYEANGNLMLWYALPPVRHLGQID